MLKRVDLAAFAIGVVIAIAILYMVPVVPA